MRIQGGRKPVQARRGTLRYPYLRSHGTLCAGASAHTDPPGDLQPDQPRTRSTGDSSAGDPPCPRDSMTAPNPKTAYRASTRKIEVDLRIERVELIQLPNRCRRARRAEFFILTAAVPATVL